MIKTEIGMPVIFHSAHGSRVGFIDRIWSEKYVDVVFFGHGAERMSSVLLHQGDDGEVNPMGGNWCQFPNWFIRLMSPVVVFRSELPADGCQPTSQVRG